MLPSPTSRTSMSGSPKTMNRLPEPVFLSSSSPIARSGFIRAWRIVRRPRVDASSPASGSNAKPHTTSRSANLTASLAASRMSSGPTVPNSGPIAIATVLVEPFSPYSPTPCTQTPGYGSRRANSSRSARFVFWTPARRRLSRMLVTKAPASHAHWAPVLPLAPSAPIRGDVLDEGCGGRAKDGRIRRAAAGCGMGSRVGELMLDLDAAFRRA